MSTHPFRRAGRNLAAAPLVYLGIALTNAGVRTMWPDDRPQTAADEAIAGRNPTPAEAKQKKPWPDGTVEAAVQGLNHMQAWLAGFREQPPERDLRAVMTMAWDSVRRERPADGGEGQAT